MVLYEAILSPALQVLFDKLSSGDILDFLGRSDLNEFLLEKLKISYFANAALLDDAEKKQYENPAIETWLELLKNAVFEAEDTLDELATEALRCKLGPTQNLFNQVRNFKPFCRGIKRRLENLTEKLEYIGKQKNVLGLESNGNGGKRTVGNFPTTPLVIESHMYGRSTEKEDIYKLLCDGEEGKFSGACVVPILGMGGIGKTTLARAVYNDERVDGYFDVKSWAHVSDDFNLIRITKSLLESATGEPCDTVNLELLQIRLRTIFSKKKFLVVLDDVWETQLWNDLLIPYMSGNPGSRIIITTRNKEVLAAMDTLPSYRLEEISDEASWSLFVHHAFGARNSEMSSVLNVTGRAIVNKCKGLPLAIKTLGSILALKLDNDYWNEILHCKLWDIAPKKNSILPSLRLSYHHLPPNLKRCFAYCSIFPKGYEFEKKHLVLLWMAEGFVQQMGKMTLEEVGNAYFSELVSRSFFQESVQNNSRYVMHDLLHDLAQSVSRKMSIHLESRENGQRDFENVRHFSFFREKYDVYKKFELLGEARLLRTFLPLAAPLSDELCYVSKKVPSDLLPNLKRLRVLSLYGYCITELPDTIGNLKHLRYFDLSYTAIRVLPQSVCKLINLQSLLVINCNYLTEFPSEMENLISLRYLDFSGSGIQEMPLGLGNLVHLRVLPRFVVGTSGSNVDVLGNLSNLQDSFWLLSLENVTSSWDAKRANLQEKKGLTQVVYEWSTNVDDSLDKKTAADILEMLQPHSEIQSVKINNFPGMRLPCWISAALFSNLAYLSLSNCKRCKVLPPVGGLPSLKELHIKEMVGVKQVGLEFYGYSYSSFICFASLEKLMFNEMLEWEEWAFNDGDIVVEAFPALRELHLEQCPKLKGHLPHPLPALTKLVIRECEQLTSSCTTMKQLHEMELRRCNCSIFSAALETRFLTSLELQKIRDLMFLPELWLQHLNRLERMVISECFELEYLARNKNGLQHLTSLRTLIIRDCSSMISLSAELDELPRKIEYLELDRCHSLKRLPHEFNDLGSLQELVITDCPKLEFDSVTIFPSNLKGLVLRGCSLESLPESTINISSLEYLYISGCLVLTSFPTGHIATPTTFRQLTIDLCPHLESLPEGMMHSSNMSLQLLEIFDCSSVTSFPSGQLPKTLKTLTFWNCANLLTLADVITGTMSLESLRIGNCTYLKYLPSGMHALPHLDYLEVDGCPGIDLFPEEGLPSSRLRQMHILNCDNLKFLAKNLQNLQSLEVLRLSNCPMIASFPDNELPSNLVSLDIKDCQNIKPCSEWGLHRLTKLRKLRLHGCGVNVDTFPEWLLPSTLEILHIEKQPNLKSLSPWLKNLTLLEELKIEECREIVLLPREGMPPMIFGDQWLPSAPAEL